MDANGKIMKDSNISNPQLGCNIFLVPLLQADQQQPFWHDASICGSYLIAHVPLVICISADPVVPRRAIQIPIFGMLLQTRGEITDWLSPPGTTPSRHASWRWIEQIPWYHFHADEHEKIDRSISQLF